MDNSVATQLQDLISKNNTIGIAVGKNPGVDEMASALSLFLVLKSQGKNVSVACPTEALVEHSNLVGIDKVKNSFEANGGDMIVSFPYEEGEIEKISYTMENGLLNIVVKAGEEGLSFGEKDVMFKRSEGYPSLLFVIGTSRLSDLDRIYDPQALKDTTVINIDNKPDNQGYGDVSMVTPSSSSISEKIGELMTSLGYNINIDAAQNLLLGVESATNNFQSPKTTALAFEMIGEFIRKGATRSAGANMQMRQEPARAEDFSDDEDLDSPFMPRNFPNPQTRIAPRPNLGQRLSRQPASLQGQNLQRLQSMQRQSVQQSRQRPQAGRQNLPSVRQEEDQDQAQPAQDKKIKNPPTDWLTPKIYKGSTNI